jgi:hypothetical protein
MAETINVPSRLMPVAAGASATAVMPRYWSKALVDHIHPSAAITRDASIPDAQGTRPFLHRTPILAHLSHDIPPCCPPISRPLHHHGSKRKWLHSPLLLSSPTRGWVHPGWRRGTSMNVVSPLLWHRHMVLATSREPSGSKPCCRLSRRPCCNAGLDASSFLCILQKSGVHRSHTAQVGTGYG